MNHIGSDTLVLGSHGVCDPVLYSPESGVQFHLPGDERRHLLKRLRLSAQDLSQAPSIRLGDVLDLSEEALRRGLLKPVR